MYCTFVRVYVGIYVPLSVCSAGSLHVCIYARLMYVGAFLYKERNLV